MVDLVRDKSETEEIRGTDGCNVGLGQIKNHI